MTFTLQSHPFEINREKLPPARAPKLDVPRRTATSPPEEDSQSLSKSLKLLVVSIR